MCIPLSSGLLALSVFYPKKNFWTLGKKVTFFLLSYASFGNKQLGDDEIYDILHRKLLKTNRSIQQKKKSMFIERTILSMVLHALSLSRNSVR